MPRSAFLALCLCALAGNAGAAPNGWLWDALIRLQWSHQDTSVEGREVGRLDVKEYALESGVEGFFVHPAFLRFQADLRVGLVDYGETAYIGHQTRFGGGFTARLFPTAPRYRLVVGGRHDGFGYGNLDTNDPYRPANLAASTSTLFSELLVTRGLLRGLRLSAQRNWYRFAGPAEQADIREREALTWSRRSRRAQRSLVIERLENRYGQSGFQSGQLRARADLRLELSERWQSDGYVQVDRIHSAYAGSDFTAHVASLFERVTRADPQKSTFDATYSGGWSAADTTGGIQTHSLSALYRRRVRDSLWLGPFASFGLALSPGQTLKRPEVGLEGDWSRMGVVATSLSGRISHGDQTITRDEDKESRSVTALSLSGSARHGTPAGLRKSLTLGWSWNQFREVGARPELPDLGASLALVGGYNGVHGRLDIERQQGRASLTLFVDGRRQNSATVDDVAVTVDSLSGALTASMGRVSLSAGASLSEARARERSEANSWFGSASVQPARRLNLSLLYRREERVAVFAPDVDASRLQANLSYYVGKTAITGSLTRYTQRVLGNPEQSDLAFTLTAQRSLSGRLPDFFSQERRGIVR